MTQQRSSIIQLSRQNALNEEELDLLLISLLKIITILSIRARIARNAKPVYNFISFNDVGQFVSVFETMRGA